MGAVTAPLTSFLPDRRGLDPTECTFTSVELALIAGCSYRMVDYWTRAGHLVPIVPSHGSGTQRIFDYPQVLRARLLTLASAARIPPSALDIEALFDTGNQILGAGLTIELDVAELTRTTDRMIAEILDVRRTG